MTDIPSIANLAALPDPAELKGRLRACAILDAIMLEKESLRCYSFESAPPGEVVMAAFRNGSGDTVHALFLGDEAIVNGFDHESDISPYQFEGHEPWPGIYDDVPGQLEALLGREPLLKEDVTFSAWYTEGAWRCGPVEFPDGEDDGSGYLLPSLARDAEAYIDWAKGYYEVDLDPAAAAKVFAGAEVTAEMVRRLQPKRDVPAALAEVEAIKAR